MTQEDKNSGNKLIAEFMGGQLRLITNTQKKWMWTGWNPNHEAILMENKLLFHEQWNWLMPIVEKIESQVGRFVIDRSFVTVKGEVLFNGSKQRIYEWNGGCVNEPKIQAIWIAVVEYIKWYKKEKSKLV